MFKPSPIWQTKTVIAFSLIMAVLFLLYRDSVSANERLSCVLDGILKKYKEFPGLAVEYQREIITKSMGMLGDQVKSDIASGHFLFKPPHYLKVLQDKPVREVITTDGQTIWWFIIEKRIVYEYPADKLGRELRLLSDIFQGLSDVNDSFDAELTESGSDTEYHLNLVPKKPWEEIDHIELYVDLNFFIRVVEIHNFLGSVTRFILGDYLVREDFEKGFFSFVAPDGVEVIKED